MEIKTYPLFENLFRRRVETINAIRDDMMARGFDKAFPLILAEGDWVDGPVLLDGYTRLLVCNELKIIPETETRKFATESEALEYAIHLQRDRRNLTKSEIIKAVLAVDTLKRKGERTDLAPGEATSGKSAERTAELLGISRSKVEKIRAIAKDEAALKLVTDGGKSINAAYGMVKSTKTTPPTKPSVEVNVEAEPLVETESPVDTAPLEPSENIETESSSVESELPVGADPTKPLETPVLDSQFSECVWGIMRVNRLLDDAKFVYIVALTIPPQSQTLFESDLLGKVGRGDLTSAFKTLLRRKLFKNIDGVIRVFPPK